MKQRRTLVFVGSMPCWLQQLCCSARICGETRAGTQVLLQERASGKTVCETEH